jgi:hypothetical protein
MNSLSGVLSFTLVRQGETRIGRGQGAGMERRMVAEACAMGVRMDLRDKTSFMIRTVVSGKVWSLFLSLVLNLEMVAFSNC